ncbi:MAG TPA: hypothetical protein VFB27_03455 [Opitutaceae bacterium]|nr:hypothetical protein [Opitutaceae bacterium]
MATTGFGAGQTPLPSPVSAVIRAEFPYTTKSNPPAKENHDAAAPASFPKAAPLAVPGLQWKDAAPLPSKGPVIPLPEFPVTAEKYLPVGSRLDTIDAGIRREESLAIPGNADLILNGDKAANFLQKFLISFGGETARKRAHDASRRLEVLEMRRIVEVALPFAAPSDKERLKDDEASLKDLSAHKLDQNPFLDPRAKN